jgi:uncharacterized protein (TIGR01777 family)
MLEAQGHTVIRIGRGVRGSADVVWDPDRAMIDASRLNGIDAAINVTGENIGQRWSSDVKRRIVESRVRSTALLAGTMATMSPRPRALVNMSAVGFYGDGGDTLLDERSASGDGFLASVVRQWEAATKAAGDAGLRVTCARCGVILHPSASILERLIPIFKLGGGGRIGSGRQWISWIALTDALRGLVYLLGNESLGGAVNLTSPEPATNAEFVETLARVLHRPALMTVPELAVKLLYGEMGAETVLAGQRVLPHRLTDAGFQLHWPTLEPAIRHEMALG